MGSAGKGSASEAVSVADWGAPSSTAGVTGTVRAHTGVVSCVGTAGTSSSGGLVDTSGGLVDTSGGLVDSSGGLVDSSGGLVDSSGGLVDSCGSSDCVSNSIIS